MLLKQLVRHGLATVWFPLYRGLAPRPEAAPPGTFRILALHNILRSQRPSFERLLAYLWEAHGIITPEEAAARLQGKAPSPSVNKIPYLLTFDDGFKNHATLVREVLDAYGCKAIFFICPGLLDREPAHQIRAIIRRSRNPGWRPAGAPDEMRLISWPEAELLAASGHCLGGHTLNHRRLKGRTDRELTEEIITSSELLASRLGLQISWFAYPFGTNVTIDSRALGVIGEHYQFCCNTYSGFNSPQTHRLQLLRTGVDLDRPFRFQQMVLAGGLDLWHRREIAALADMVGDGNH